MIIVGNSNVDCFNRLGFRMDAGCEKVKISWVGALVIQHFFQSIPIGEKVRSLFAAEEGWRFLSIGTHDVYELWLAASKGMLAEAFATMVRRYEFVFKEFASSGKFGWIVFAQPLHEVNFPNLEDKHKLEIVRTFKRRISKLCINNGIALVDPLDRILGTDGLPLSQYLQKDRLHMNQEGAALYVEEISMVTSTDISFQPKEVLFEPRSETESFCSLLLNNLNMEAERAISGDELQTALAEFVTERLRQKGLDLSIDADTELVDSGLLDSLDLVETYTFATSALGMDILFDINLRDLNTIQKISEYLIGQKNGGSPSESASKPVHTDFWLSLRGDFNDPDERIKILEAENHISLLDDRTFVALQEDIMVAQAGNFCNYGIVPFWVALNQARRGHYPDALNLLGFCSNPKLHFPFEDLRVEFYREMWLAKSQGLTSPAVEFPQKAERAQMDVPIWEKAVEKNVISLTEAYPGEPPVGKPPCGSAAQILSPAQSCAPTPAKGYQPLISAIVSTYNAERFLRGCLEDLEAQTIANKVEIIVIDSGSEQNERGIVEEFRQKYHNIRYVRTERESLYAAWNRGIRLAAGKYITNANTDDRHRKDAFEIQLKTLEENPGIDLVYGDCFVSSKLNETFYENQKQESLCYPVFFAPDVLFRYQFGPQPMWRKGVHEHVGFFDERFRAAGDYEFNIRFCFQKKAMHIPEFLGLYLKHDGALSFKDSRSSRETRWTIGRYRTIENVERLYVQEGIACSSAEERSRVHLDFGTRLLQCHVPLSWFHLRRTRQEISGEFTAHLAFASRCFISASRLAPGWVAPYNNLALDLYLMDLPEKATSLLDKAYRDIPHPNLQFNRDIITAAKEEAWKYSQLKFMDSGLSSPTFTTRSI